MQFVYPAVFKKEEGGRILVSFPDFPECITDGKDEKEALLEGQDALEEAIAGRINRAEPLPMPSIIKKRFHPVTVGAHMAAKAALYMALKEKGMTKKTLAKHLHCDEKEARRLLDPHHASKMERLEDALSIFGKHLVIEVERQMYSRRYKR